MGVIQIHAWKGVHFAPEATTYDVIRRCVTEWYAFGAGFDAV